MCRAAQADGHNAPGLIDRTDPGEAALVEDVGVGYEDSVRQPVVAHELPDILDRIEFGHFAGSGNTVMVAGTMSAPEPCHSA